MALIASSREDQEALQSAELEQSVCLAGRDLPYGERLRVVESALSGGNGERRGMSMQGACAQEFQICEGALWALQVCLMNAGPDPRTVEFALRPLTSDGAETPVTFECPPGTHIATHHFTSPLYLDPEAWIQLESRDGQEGMTWQAVPHGFEEHCHVRPARVSAQADPAQPAGDRDAWVMCFAACS
jgi:hypothetical protein